MRQDWHQKLLPFFLLYLALSFLLFLLDDWGISAPARGKVESLIVPLKTSLRKVKEPQGNTFQIQKYQAEKESEIASLKSEISVLRSENAAIRRLLGTPLPSDWHFLPAQVMATSTDYLEIDKGRAEGVKEGMVVVWEKVLVGKIIRTGEHFAQVLLPFSESAKILAISRREGQEGILAKGLILGQGGRLVFDRVLPRESLEEDDLVMTAGDEIFPPNLLLGKVGKIHKKAGEIYQWAEIESLIQTEKLELVFIITRR